MSSILVASGAACLVVTKIKKNSYQSITCISWSMSGMGLWYCTVGLGLDLRWETAEDIPLFGWHFFCTIHCTTNVVLYIIFLSDKVNTMVLQETYLQSYSQLNIRFILSLYIFEKIWKGHGERMENARIIKGTVSWDFWPPFLWIKLFL